MAINKWIVFPALPFLFILPHTINKCKVLRDETPAYMNTHTQTHTHRAYYEVLASVSGRRHHSGSAETRNLVAAEHNERQHNGAERDTMLPRAINVAPQTDDSVRTSD